MKKTIFSTVTVVMAVTIFTACTKNVNPPVNNANSVAVPIHAGNTSSIIKKPGYTGGTGMPDSTKTTTQP